MNNETLIKILEKMSKDKKVKVFGMFQYDIKDVAEGTNTIMIIY